MSRKIVQLKDNEIVDSGSLKGDRPLYTGDRYIQVNFTVNKKRDFREVVRSVTVTYTVTAIYRALIYRFHCIQVLLGRLIRE